VKRKKMVDIREANLKRRREWEFAQANYSEAGWLMANFQTAGLDKEIFVKSPFRDWYGNWLEFQIGLDGNGEVFLHDDGRYLRMLEENHADIFPEVRKRFLERRSGQAEERKGFIMKETGCSDRELPRFIIEMQGYCLALAELVKIVIEVEEASRLKVDHEVKE